MTGTAASRVAVDSQRTDLVVANYTTGGSLRVMLNGTNGSFAGEAFDVRTPADSVTGTAGACIANTKSVENFAIGEWWKVYTGEIGNFQIGLQFNWLERKAFNGVGGDPIANIRVLQDKDRILAIMKDGKFHKRPQTQEQRRRLTA